MFGMIAPLGRSLDGRHPEDKLALRFLEVRSQYKQLGEEIAYILTKRLRKTGVEYSTVTSRAKSLKSFVEKKERKGCVDAFEEIRDLAGVRVVYLYKSDFPKIEGVIQEEFNIIEKDDTNSNKDIDRFGYTDVKFYVKLGKLSQGARYDDLKDLLCEIQVRTVAQDAWAIISHHLIYKKEAQVPKEHQKALKDLVEVFRHADDQFDNIHTVLEKYKQEIADKRNKENLFLEQPINLDTLKAFVETYLNVSRPLLLAEIMYLGNLIDGLHKAGYKTLKELYTAVEKAWNVIKAWRDLTKPPAQMYYVGVDLQIALALTNKSYKEKFCGEVVRNFVDENKHLLKS